MEQQAAEVRIVRAADRTTAGSYFQAPIEGNTVTHCGLIELGAARLKMALVETEAGAFFPFQYHAGGGDGDGGDHRWRGHHRGRRTRRQPAELCIPLW